METPLLEEVLFYPCVLLKTDCGWGYTQNPSTQEPEVGQPAPLGDPV